MNIFEDNQNKFCQSQKSQNSQQQQQQQQQHKQQRQKRQQQQQQKNKTKRDNEQNEVEQFMLKPITGATHPLEHTWSFWIYKTVSTNFEDNLTYIEKDIETVEDFWQLMNLIKEVNKLPKDCGYYFFKKNIRPMWEDNANSSGGRWLISNRRNDRSSDKIWREILLALIGEQFGQYNDQITGAFVVRKSFADRIGVWTMQCHDKDACVGIGKLLKKKTNVRTLNYEAHDPKQNVSYSV